VTDEPLTDEMVEAKWAEIAPLIDVMITRIQTPGEFSVQPDSQLTADDIARSSYQVSHAARWCPPKIVCPSVPMQPGPISPVMARTFRWRQRGHNATD
jgi:hypothetical protein